jgi:catechol 2,3-dioxygenase-like lactoylglutathione lyase family enzyme
MMAWGWVSIREQRMIQGLSHLTFIVRDLDRMEALLTTVLGAEKVYDSGKATFSLSKERFFVAGGLWLATMEGEPYPPAPTITSRSRSRNLITPSCSAESIHLG